MTFAIILSSNVRRHEVDFKSDPITIEIGMSDAVGRDARQGIGDWMTFYNQRRPHAAHGDKTPVGVDRERLSASGPGLGRALHPTALVA